MGINRGKAWETKFKEDWIKSMPDSSIDRLYDPVNGYTSIANISDFICYKYPNIFYMECKSHEGNTFPISALTQYEKLSKKVGIKGVRAGVVLWFIDHDCGILYVPISTFTKLIQDGKKSFNVKMIDDPNYPCLKIPSVKKRVFYDADYSVLCDLEEGW